MDIYFTAILITALSLAFLSPLLRFMNTPDEIFSEAYEYIFILCAGLFATIGYNMFAGLFRAVGNSRTPLYYLILSSVLNVALDVILIPFWGVCGAALATVAAQAVSAVLCGISFFKRYGDLSPRGENFNLSRELLSDLLSTGCAMAMMLCVVNLGSIIFQRANNRLGEEIIAAHSSAHKIFTLFLQPISTLATALSAFVSQNRGAGQYGRIRSTLRSVLIIVSALGAFSCAVVYLSGDIFIRLITGTESDVILSNAVMAMRISLPFFPILGILQCLRTAMQAMGQKWAPVLSSVIELILKSVGAFFLIPALGYFGACITEPLTWVSMLVFLAAAYFGTRKHMYKGTKA